MPARAVVLGVLLLTLATPPAAAQTPVDTAQAVQDSAVRVFLDCPNYYCDLDFFRTEITFVNYVREPQDAQVHVLLTTQQTGAGGTEFTLTFLGQKEFAGTADTLRHAAPPASTDDEIRREIAKILRLGLVRFAARTPVAPHIEISYDAPARAAARVRDPWNYWVFRARVNTNLNGEQSYKFVNVNGTISADRITEDWKIRFSAREGYNQSAYELPIYDTAGTQTGIDHVTNITRDFNGDVLVVRSLGSHWSAGWRASASASTYLNQDLRLRTAPAIEYNIYRYAESTRRQLTLQYQVGIVRFDYTDTTIYNRTVETRFDQSLTASLNIIQPWGSAGMSLEGRAYLHDLRRNSVQLFGNASVRLFKGLSVELFGQISLLHDQIYLAAGGATSTEVLLRRRQLETGYSYWAFSGLSYTFGSIYNNIVNPRF